MTAVDIEGGDDFREFADDLRDAASQIRFAIDIALRRTALAVERTAKENAPVDTGTLHTSIRFEKLSAEEYVVGTGVEYAPDVEFGTQPHVITPTSAEALAFEGRDGDLIFRSRVEHPGTPAQPYLRPALREHRSDLVQNIRQEISRVFRSVFGT